MQENSTILDKQPGGWTLIMLLVVMAIIALLMMYYLPSILQRYSPPSVVDKEGTSKPIIKYVQEELAPIEQRNKELEDVLNQQTGQDQEDNYEE